MAENSAGRAALSGGDPHLLAALRAVYGDPSSMITQALGQTQSEPVSEGTPLQDFLRERGFHYLAGDEEE